MFGTEDKVCSSHIVNDYKRNPMTTTSMTENKRIKVYTELSFNFKILSIQYLSFIARK
jgi:hypothetical protein